MIRELINKNIKNLEILDIISYREKKYESGRSMYTVIALMKWVAHNPVIEKRQFFYTESNKLTCGKCMSLEKTDVEDIMSNGENIIEKMGSL